MKATTNIDKAEVPSHTQARFDGDETHVPATGQAGQKQNGAKEQVTGTGKPESELRAAARRRGLTMKELAARVGVTPGHLSAVAIGRRPWSSAMREKVAAVLGEVPGQGIVYRQGGLVKGESAYIRESAPVRSA